MSKAKQSSEVTARIQSLDDWRGTLLAEAREAICAASPDIVEEMKWRKPSNPAGVPTWSQDGLICTGETYKDKVKLTFARGAALADPDGLFNASLDAGTRRAIDLREGDPVNAKALTDLVRQAIAENESRT